MSLPSDDFAERIFFEICKYFPKQDPGSIQSTNRILRPLDPSDKPDIKARSSTLYKLTISDIFLKGEYILILFIKEIR